MNTKVQFHNHPTKPSVQLNSFIEVGEFEKEQKSVSGALDKPSTEETNTMSVRALRNIFLQKTLEGGAPSAMPTLQQITEGDGRTTENIKEHYEGSERSETTSSGADEGKSVKELKQLYEAKVKALSSSAGRVVSQDHPFSTAFSRPPTASSEERQDTVSVDIPHPDGQHVYQEEAVGSNTSAKWYVASSKIKEIPNGMCLSIVLKHGNRN